jgi:hypothetical protein
VALDASNPSTRVDLPRLPVHLGEPDPTTEDVRELRLSPRYCRAIVGSGFMRRQCMKLYPCPIHRSERQ